MSDVLLTAAECALWLLQEADPALCAYNVVVPVRVAGHLDISRAESATTYVVAAHPVLGSRVLPDAGAAHFQFGSAGTPRLRVVDLSGAGDFDAASAAWCRLEGRRPFQLSAEPPLRVWLLTGAEDDLLVFTLHHLACDGTALQILIDDFCRYYADGPSEPPRAPERAPLPAGPDAGTGLLRTAWRSLLEDAPPTSSLPVRRRARPPVFRHEGDRVAARLDAPAARRLYRWGRTHRATPLTAVVAAGSLALAARSRQLDLVLGTTVSHRDVGDRSIGYRAGIVPFRVRLPDAEATLGAAIDETGRALRQSYDLADLPFADIVEAVAPHRGTAANALCQVVFNHVAWPPPPVHIGDLPGTVLDIHNHTAKFDLSIDLRTGARGVEIVVEYATALFTRAEAQEFLATLTALLSSENLDEATARRPAIAGPPEPWAPPGDATLHDAFLARAARWPAAVAVSDDSESLAYRELAARASALAARLRLEGAAPGQFVGLVLGRSCRQVVAILGTLLTGAAYLPLATDTPATRLGRILATARPVAIVAERPLATDVAQVVGGTPVLLIEEAESDDEAAPVPGAVVSPDAPAYAIFTSGSTGEPKGVVVTHRNVLRLVSEAQRWYGFDASDVWTVFHSYTFDVSVFEMWGALLHGGRLVVVPEHAARAPDEFYTLLQREGVTVLSQTPSAFKNLLLVIDSGADVPGNALRYVIFAGEKLEIEALRRWFDLFGDTDPELINMYGITETTVHVTFRRIRKDDLDIGGSPIGVPLADLRLHLLDEDLRPVAADEVGELFVGGPGVAQGYLRRAGLTADRFVPDPYGPPGARMYRSGDLAIRSNGELHYRGRKDTQVKVRGYRVEPGEIERVLLDHPGVAAAVVLKIEDHEGGSLQGFVVPKAGEVLAEDELRLIAAARLPAYMVPARFHVLSRLPLTVNGKVDRRRLAAGPTLVGAGTASVEPADGLPHDELSRAIRSAWESVGVTSLSDDDSFLLRGGDSLRAARLASELTRTIGRPVSVRQVFDNLTVAAMRTALLRHDSRGGAGPDPGRPSSAAPGGGRRGPVTFQQASGLAARAGDDRYNLENLPIGFTVTGRWEQALLEPALRSLHERHDGLRTRFDLAGEQFAQVVEPDAVIDLRFVDLRTDAGGLPGRIAADIDAPFDLSRPPAMRTRVYRTADDVHHVLFVLDHTVTDGVSIQRFLREFQDIYNYLAGGRPVALAPVVMQPIDFALWQRRAVEDDLRDQITHWLDRLSGEPAEAALPLAADTAGDRGPARAASGDRYAGGSLRVPFGADVTGALARSAEHLGVSAFAVVLAAWQLVVKAAGGAGDRPIRFAVANRVRPEYERTFARLAHGNFIRLSGDEDAPFSDLVRATWNELQSAFAHQEAPIEYVLELLRDRGSATAAPTGQCSFTLQDDPTDNLVLRGASVTGLELPPTARAKRPLSFYLYRSRRGLSALVVYQRARYTPGTVRQLTDLLQRAIALVESRGEDPVRELIGSLRSLLPETPSQGRS
jgi:amino acid adenylation domain-containing protein